MEPCTQNLFGNLISPVSEKLLLILLALPATPHFFTPPCTETLCRNYRLLQLPILWFPPKFAAVRPLYPPPHPLLINLMVVFSPQQQDWLTALRRLTNPSSWKRFASRGTPALLVFLLLRWMSLLHICLLCSLSSPNVFILECPRVSLAFFSLSAFSSLVTSMVSRQPCADDHQVSLPIPDSSSLLPAISTWICNRHLI